MNIPTIKDLWQNLAFLIALGFGSGCAPKAPGTFGSLVALGFVPFLLWLSLQNYILFLGVCILFGFWLCDFVAKKLGTDDPACIVWDEFVGIWLTFFLISWYELDYYWFWLLVGFGLFRLFDILKPFPVNYFDKNFKGGFGIMLDDIVAGILAGICLNVLFWILKFIS